MKHISTLTSLCIFSQEALLHIPNGKRIWSWYERAPTTASDASKLRIRKQSKNSGYSQENGPISHIVWTD